MSTGPTASRQHRQVSRPWLEPQASRALRNGGTAACVPGERTGGVGLGSSGRLTGNTGTWVQEDEGQTDVQ